jgi:hypothetical protein
MGFFWNPWKQRMTATREYNNDRKALICDMINSTQCGFHDMRSVAFVIGAWLYWKEQRTCIMMTFDNSRGTATGGGVGGNVWWSTTALGMPAIVPPHGNADVDARKLK